MNKLTIKLKQHTPIIHFQHDQDGATLRATEVKPKLDRFILTKLGEGNYDTGRDMAKKNGWLVGKGEHGALDYKMRIEASEVHMKDVPKNLLYFGNMGRQDKQKYSFSKKTIELFLFSFNDNIIKEIEKYKDEFFLVTNFGTRQSKGFGSFFIDVESPFNLIDLYSNDYIEVDTIDDHIIEATIDYYYRRLKSGISRVNNQEKPYEYQKSFLKLNNPEIYWEKKFFKNVFFGENIGDDQAIFLRAILGLPSSYTFRPGNLDKLGKNKLEDEYIIDIEENKSITRIASPIIFKIIKDLEKTRIVIITSEIATMTYEKMKDVEFRFIAYFVFKYYELDKFGHKILKKNSKDYKTSSIKIKMDGSNIQKLTEDLLANSIDGDRQKERLDKFIKWNNGDKYVSLYLPENKISIKNLIINYHTELNNEFDVKYINTGDNYYSIKTAKIKNHE